jgi:hypothetical protein
MLEHPRFQLMVDYMETRGLLNDLRAPVHVLIEHFRGGKMMRVFSGLLFVVLSHGLAAQPAPGANGKVLLPRATGQTIDLRTSKGQSYLATLLAPNGIYAQVGSDDTTPVTIATPAAITSAIATFDPTVAKNLYGAFAHGQTDFVTSIGKIQGQSISPKDIRGILMPLMVGVKSQPQLSVTTDRAYGMALLASSSGTLIEIDANNYFYNVAYDTADKATGSGRSYGVAATRALLDQTDRGYLGELDAYLKGATASEVSNFYKTLFQVFTDCDSSGMSGLISFGQVVGTDFLTVYTAELIRNNMVQLNPATDPWQIDIGEVTLLAAYGAISGMGMANGKLVAGGDTVYGTKSIGEQQTDFTHLGKLITSFETSKHPDLVTAVQNLTLVPSANLGKPGKGDIFWQALVYLNRPEFQADVHTNAAAITAAMTALLMQVRNDSAQITAYVQAHPAAAAPARRLHE